MSCNSATLAGLAKDCTPSMGGIVEVLIANYEDVTNIGINSGKISSIELASSAKFKKYQFRRNSGSMTSTDTIDESNGVKFVTTELSLVFNRMETTKRVEIEALGINDLVCLVKDANNAWWYLGYDHPVNASARNGQTGTQFSDANGYTITLQDISREMPYEVNGDIIAGLL